MTFEAQIARNISRDMLYGTQKKDAARITVKKLITFFRESRTVKPCVLNIVSDLQDSTSSFLLNTNTASIRPRRVPPAR